MTKKCVICDVEFNAKRSDAEVCSAKCRQANWRRKIEATRPESPEVIIEGLEAQIKKMEAENQTLKIEIQFRDTTIKDLKEQIEMGGAPTATNKPNTDLKTEKPVVFAKPKKKAATGFNPMPKTVEESIDYKAPEQEFYDVPRLSKDIRDEPGYYGATTLVPTTLEALKKLCPPELKGVDRTIWINDNRKKYNL